jgi:hypothetical protein
MEEGSPASKEEARQREIDETLLRVYEQLFATWRSQVDSYWQRSNYFAAFETAAIAGCWYVLSGKDGKPWAGCTLSLLGIGLTIVWFCNNYKTHRYISYWWEKLAKAEEKAGLTRRSVDFVTQQKGGGFPRYHYLPQAVSAIFLIAWLVLFIWSLLLSCAKG